jgi:hypothetical protein
MNDIQKKKKTFSQKLREHFYYFATFRKLFSRQYKDRKFRFNTSCASADQFDLLGPQLGDGGNPTPPNQNRHLDGSGSFIRPQWGGGGVEHFRAYLTKFGG